MGGPPLGGMAGNALPQHRSPQAEQPRSGPPAAGRWGRIGIPCSMRRWPGRRCWAERRGLPPAPPARLPQAYSHRPRTLTTLERLPSIAQAAGRTECPEAYDRWMACRLRGSGLPLGSVSEPPRIGTRGGSIAGWLRPSRRLSWPGQSVRCALSSTNPQVRLSRNLGPRSSAATSAHEVAAGRVQVPHRLPPALVHMD
jgi:hypothetical protein